jgi:hypothetical protein
MRSKVCILALAASACAAKIVRVPAQAPGLQAGIDAAADGDTVLAEPGTYFERIRFNGKRVTLGSRFIFSGDTSDIPATVIDAGGGGRAVSFVNAEGPGAVLTGFTIQNGSNGTGLEGGGIFVDTSAAPCLRFLRVRNCRAEYGGGLYCGPASHPLLEDVRFSGNSANSGGAAYFRETSDVVLRRVTADGNTVTWTGGAFLFQYGSARLDGVRIYDNGGAVSGGGVTLASVRIGLSDVAIVRNEAPGNGQYAGSGGGLYASESTVEFDSMARCNIHSNRAAVGSDLFAVRNSVIRVVVDTFTVLVPTAAQASPLKLFTFDIRTAKTNPQTDLFDYDVYVGPSGDDSANGRTPAEALKTITHALSSVLVDQQHPRILHLLDGTYSPSANGERFPLVLPSFITLRGTDRTRVVLDAESQGRVITAVERSSIVLKRLTVRGGMAENGGGVFCEHAGVRLDTIDVVWNRAGESGGYGGGLYIANGSNVQMTGVLIAHNRASMGGGMVLWSQTTTGLRSVTIRNNRASSDGGGMLSVSTAPLFDRNDRCSVYANEAGRTGSDFNTDTRMTVFLDTFSVAVPTARYAYPADLYTFDILHAVSGQVAQDVYVSPDGNDGNTGLSAGSPFRTVTHALSAIRADREHPLTVHLGAGLYSPATNGETFPIRPDDYVSLAGESERDVVLNADSTGGVLYFEKKKGIRLENLTVTGGSTEWGGGVFCNGTALAMDRVTVVRNSAAQGGGIALGWGSDAVLRNVTVADNRAVIGLGILVYESSPLFIQITVVGNRLGLGFNPDMAGFTVDGNARPRVFDSILRGNSGAQIGDFNILSECDVTHSDIEGGWPGEGNIDRDPLFADSAALDFRLRPGSPCIDAGTALWTSGQDTLAFLPGSAYQGAAPDMGACEFGADATVHPGDTDDNGLVDEWDIVPIGLFFLGSGPPRQGASLAWRPQTVQAWDAWNAVFADANGDGEVNETDVAAIGVHWGETHGGDWRRSGGLHQTADETLAPHAAAFRALYDGLRGGGEPFRKMRALLEEILPPERPAVFALDPNFPNPFNSETALRFHLPASASVTIRLYNVRGELVETVCPEKPFGAGTHQFRLRADRLGSGVYCVAIEAAGLKAVRKVVVLK